MRLVPVLGLLLVGCVYRQAAIDPPAAFYAEPTVVTGPPGGGMDSSFGATGDGLAAPGEVVGTVTDGEIVETLDGYGYWVEDAEYGRIWRPYATVVGADFTPYETCGTWVWTDYGWTFSCDWDWGWLAFHYGYWGWFDDAWAWVPDYTWSPAHVEWRTGGGYIGWRPLHPRHRNRVRDHRDHSPDQGPTIRDHRDRGAIVRDHRGRRSGQADWRFVADRDFGGRRIRPSLASAADGLASTTVGTPPPAGTGVTRIHDVMRNRFAVRGQLTGRPPYGGSSGHERPPGYDRPVRPPSGYRPTRPSGFDRPAGYDRPTVPRPSYDRPASGYDRPPPQRPSYDRPASGYDRPPPQRPSYDRPTIQRPSYDRPASSYDRPRPSADRPSPRPSYDRPVQQRPSSSRDHGRDSGSRSSSSSSSSSSSTRDSSRTGGFSSGRRR